MPANVELSLLVKEFLKPLLSRHIRIHDGLESGQLLIIWLLLLLWRLIIAACQIRLWFPLELQDCVVEEFKASLLQ